MKLSVIYPIMNQHELATACIDSAINSLDGSRDVEFVILDNGSDKPFEYKCPANKPAQIKIIRYERSMGVYPTFWEGLKHATGDILAFFHSDLAICDNDWDGVVLRAFEFSPAVGLAGFIGSTEIDEMGGRGGGTTSNFQGGTVTNGDRSWTGSPAEVHGRRKEGITECAVIDGCAMIFRRSVLEKIPRRPDFPLHHFYDRLLSCEVMERGYKIITIGIACDHISGQTVNQEPKYANIAREWAEMHGLKMGEAHNWDTVIYREAERQWLTEYRDQKHFIPRRITLNV